MRKRTGPITTAEDIKLVSDAVDKGVVDANANYDSVSASIEAQYPGEDNASVAATSGYMGIYVAEQVARYIAANIEDMEGFAALLKGKVAQGMMDALLGRTSNDDLTIDDGAHDRAS